MPELPEVEITVKNLNQIIQPPIQIEEWIFFRKDLRNKIPIKKINSLKDRNLLKIYRKGKFIIFEFKDYSILSHLGMTGVWRLEMTKWTKQKHDHIAFKLSSGSFLVYNDPRRFGEFDLFANEKIHLRFKHFGIEPLEELTDWQSLTKKFKKLKTSVKVALMNQKHIMGVGNIYASEALFRARINPKKEATKVSVMAYEKLWDEVKKVLAEAIAAGGSSISDFKNSYGEKGDFQNRFLVYDRKNLKCKVCSELIQSVVLGGRSTFWCKSCQK
jgi:formamidopyrimidine-DNA glycosylase